MKLSMIAQPSGSYQFQVYVREFRLVDKFTDCSFILIPVPRFIGRRLFPKIVNRMMRGGTKKAPATIPFG